MTPNKGCLLLLGVLVPIALGKEQAHAATYKSVQDVTQPVGVLTLPSTHLVVMEKLPCRLPLDVPILDSTSCLPYLRAMRDVLQRDRFSVSLHVRIAGKLSKNYNSTRLV